MNGSKVAVGAAEGIKAPHNVIMEDRHTLTVSGISDVDSFDEQTVIVFTDMGELTVKGEGLHINRLSLEVGEIMIEGNISSLSYSDSKPTQEGGFWSRVFPDGLHSRYAAADDKFFAVARLWILYRRIV